MTEIASNRDAITFRTRRRRELLTFALLAFGIWPIVAVGVVGGYGFLVWMYQLVNGPPGPHEVTPAAPQPLQRLE